MPVGYDLACATLFPFCDEYVYFKYSGSFFLNIDRNFACDKKAVFRAAKTRKDGKSKPLKRKNNERR